MAHSSPLTIFHLISTNQQTQHLDQQSPSKSSENQQSPNKPSTSSSIQPNENQSNTTVNQGIGLRYVLNRSKIQNAENSSPQKSPSKSPKIGQSNPNTPVARRTRNSLQMSVDRSNNGSLSTTPVKQGTSGSITRSQTKQTSPQKPKQIVQKSSPTKRVIFSTTNVPNVKEILIEQMMRVLRREIEPQDLDKHLNLSVKDVQGFENMLEQVNLPQFLFNFSNF